MNQAEHLEYTVKEWNSAQFSELLDAALERKPKVIYDIGACVGGWSKVVSQRTKAKIHAFEPFKDNFDALSENVRDIPSITVHNFGIYYGKSEAKASWRGSNIGAIFIDEIDTTMSVPTYQTFQLKTLEEFSKKKPDLIKLDVEGAEKNIIKNSKQLAKVDSLIIEWHFTGKEDAIEFFAMHLPHKVVKNIDNGMFLLCLE